MPPQNRPVIKGIRFGPVDNTVGGFFGDAALAFSENLTCIIGPRGSGKSAIIETIRFALGHRLHRDKTLEGDARQRLRSVLRDTQVSLWISPPEQDDLLVRRSLDTDGKAYDFVGTPSSIDPASSSATQVETYGWSEVEQLGRDWAAQRELIDGAATDLRDLCRAVSDVQTALGNNRSEAVSCARQIERRNIELAELPDLERQMQALDSPELREAFEEADRASRVERLVEGAEAHVGDAVAEFLDDETGQPLDVAATITSLVSELISEAEDQSLDLPGPLLSPEFERSREQLVARLEDLRVALSNFLSLLSDAKRTAINRKVAAKRAAEERLLDAFRADIEADKETEDSVRRKAERRNEIKERYDHLIETRETRDQLRRRLEDLLRHRAEYLVPTIANALNDVSSWRHDKALEITDRLSEFASRAPVSVEVEPLGDRLTFATRLYDSDNQEGLLRRSGVHAFSERDIAAGIAEKFLPWELVAAIQSGNQERIEEIFRGDGKGNPVQDARRLIDHLRSREANGDHQPERLDSLLAIEETLVDDKPVIMLEGAPIETLSPGQRCTALMPIILTEGDCPLLIDQPEDNLDNTMVFHVLVDVLRQLKDSRQVIVATHNPNIPVSGDAEQVIVLRHRTLREGEVVEQGAVDLPEIVAHVTEIMEGGEQAFQTRARKYGYDIRLHDRLR